MRPPIQIIFALLLVVGAASTADGQQINAITNGAFQSGSSGWTTFGSFYADSRFSNCHSCPGYAYLSNNDGTGGNNLVGWITQQVSIPAGATGASLTFWYSITTTDTSGVPHDVVSVTLIDSTTNASTLVHAFDNRNAGSGYSSSSYDLSNFVGKTFTVQFLGSTDGSSPTVFRIDDVAATYTPAPPPPPPPQPPSPPTNLVATGSGNSINLTWNDNANNELAYEVQRASLGGASGPLTTLGANRTTYTDSIGAFGVINCYQVRATNTAGVSGYTNQACGTTLAPPNLSFPADGASLTNASVAMSWQSALGATNYIVNVGRSCGGTEIVNGQSTIEVSLSIPVSQGTYVWQVQTRNTNYPGASAFSQCRTFAISTNPAPIANFTWSPQSPNAGQSVSFTDQSSNATSWLWTFGDASTSVLQNPAHTFGAAGNYTVGLTATNSIGSNSTTRTVTVIAPPVASFTSSPVSPTTGQAVAFTDTSTGAPTSWQWSFGDTATSSNQNPSHVYSAAGTYTVTLTASNAAGGNTTSRQIQVGTTPTLPVASFTYSPANPQTSQTVSFTDTSSGSPTAWQWSFGDGASSTSQNPSHVFTNANAYHIVMSAANVAGANSTAQDLKVVAVPHAPTASFTYSPQSPAAGQAVAFTDTSGFVPTSWAWNFGDGGTSAAQSPTHTFPTAGTFTISLTATNSAGTNAANQPLMVRATGSAPTANFTYSPNPPQAGQLVTFSDTSGGSPNSWLWTFSDGGTATAATTAHTFAVAGAYSVTLVATNGFGSNSTSQQINAKPASAKLSADFSWSPTNPTMATNVAFKDASTGNPTSWLWSFDDNSTSTQQNPSHDFSTVGSYLVGLTAKNSGGTSATVHAVVVGAPPQPDFTFQPSTPKIGENVQFVANAQGVVDSWEWDFDDGATSTIQSPTHTFAAAQTFGVRLTARNRYGEATKSKTINVAQNTFTCPTCVHVRGTITLGATPLASFADIRVQLVGQDTYSSALGEGGSFDLAAPPGDYSLQAVMTYNDTVANPATFYQKRTAIIRVPVHLPTTAVHELTFPPPVIFVHGIQSGPARWKSWADALAPSGSPQMVGAVNYLDTDDYSTEAAAIAFQLRLLFSQLTAKLPTVRVIAHSKGGLVTRVLIGDNRDFAEAVSDVIQLGTPNIGTDCYNAGIVKLLPAPYQFHLRPEDVLAAIASNRLYDNFDNGRAVHAIAGTENLLENGYLEGLTPSVCSDSCALHGGQANDGVVPVASVARFDTTTSSRSIPTLLVPYHHEELGTDKTLYLLTSVIMPYYYQNRQFPSCTAITDGCTGTSCGSGHGYTSTCNIASPFSSIRMNIVSWYLPIAGLHDSPFGVSVSSTVGTPVACSGSGGAGAFTEILGYRILRSGDPSFRDGGERIGFVGPSVAPFTFSQSFVDADPPAGLLYYAVAMVKRGNVQTSPVIASGSTPRPRPSRP